MSASWMKFLKKRNERLGCRPQSVWLSSLSCCSYWIFAQNGVTNQRRKNKPLFINECFLKETIVFCKEIEITFSSFMCALTYSLFININGNTSVNKTIVLIREIVEKEQLRSWEEILERIETSANPHGCSFIAWLITVRQFQFFCACCMCRFNSTLRTCVYLPYLRTSKQLRHKQQRGKQQVYFCGKPT